MIRDCAQEAREIRDAVALTERIQRELEAAAIRLHSMAADLGDARQQAEGDIAAGMDSLIRQLRQQAEAAEYSARRANTMALILDNDRFLHPQTQTAARVVKHPAAA